MVYNTSIRQQQINAAKDVAIKMQYEAKLTKTIKKKYFNSVSKSFYSNYKDTGNIISADHYREKLATILDNHYNDVSDKFSDQIRNKLGQPDERAVEIDRLVDTRNIIQNIKHVNSSTHTISSTTQDDLHDSVEKTIAEATAIGVILNSKKIAKQARIKFDEKSLGRISSIAATETQQPAEAAKQNELNVLVATGAIIAGIKIAELLRKKKWVAILDNVTRPEHAAADEQVVAVDQPYIVGGEQLMRPGDTSLGATIGNIINCRCSSLSILSK